MKKKATLSGIVESACLIRRREFLAMLAAGAGSMYMLHIGCSSRSGTNDPPHKLIYVALDSLHPNYLTLNSDGMPGGSDGDWLMPNVNKFLKNSMWYPKAKSYLPAATDMNHLNAIAGTNSGLTGIIGVSAEMLGWDSNGKAIIKQVPISFTRDDQGRPVDTIFHAWKGAWPGSKTAYISGKGWVAQMYRDGVVDIVVDGKQRMPYLNMPRKESFADPETDPDASCDPESKGSTGLNGQDNILRIFTESQPELFPHDSWVVESALEIFSREKPDLAYILMAQADDAGHFIGAGWDPSEFVNASPAIVPPAGCADKPAYQRVSKYNPFIYREGPLDAIRDVDTQFGKLMDGLKNTGVLNNAIVILLSDHSMLNYLDNKVEDTDLIGIMKNGGAMGEKNVLSMSLTSMESLYWRDGKGRVPLAKTLLMNHKAYNRVTMQNECPWYVLDRNDMKCGMEGVALPGELYSRYFVEIDGERTMVWPDLIVLAKGNWQLPVYNGNTLNIGIKLPEDMPPVLPMLGGHSSLDTQPIVMAISVPDGKTGVSQKETRIGDMGVTAASLMGLRLQSSTVGIDLSPDLV